jgi:hypothetical protein
MTSGMTASIRRAMRRVSTPTLDPVHFHVDSDGRAFVCDFHRCDSPALTLREAGLTETGARRRVR